MRYSNYMANTGGMAIFERRPKFVINKKDSI